MLSFILQNPLKYINHSHHCKTLISLPNSIFVISFIKVGQYPVNFSTIIKIKQKTSTATNAKKTHKNNRVIVDHPFFVVSLCCFENFIFNLPPLLLFRKWIIDFLKQIILAMISI